MSKHSLFGLSQRVAELPFRNELPAVDWGWTLCTVCQPGAVQRNPNCWIEQIEDNFGWKAPRGWRQLDTSHDCNIQRCNVCSWKLAGIEWKRNLGGSRGIRLLNCLGNIHLFLSFERAQVTFTSASTSKISGNIIESSDGEFLFGSGLSCAPVSQSFLTCLAGIMFQAVKLLRISGSTLVENNLVSLKFNGFVESAYYAAPETPSPTHCQPLTNIVAYASIFFKKKHFHFFQNTRDCFRW